MWDTAARAAFHAPQLVGDPFTRAHRHTEARAGRDATVGKGRGFEPESQSSPLAVSHCQAPRVNEKIAQETSGS